MKENNHLMNMINVFIGMDKNIFQAYKNQTLLTWIDMLNDRLYEDMPPHK